MLKTFGTWMMYRGDGTKDEENLAALTVSADSLKAVLISQFIELRDKDNQVIATITWPSTTKVRKIGA